MFELLGDSPEAAKQEADTVMRIETALAKASLTRVERRDPYKLHHKMNAGRLATDSRRASIGRSTSRLARCLPFETMNVDRARVLQGAQRAVEARSAG